MTGASQNSGFHAVDASGQAVHLAAEMSRVAANEFTQRYLARGLDLLNLQPTAHVADVGCGHCPDLADICARLSASGSVHLVEPSSSFLAQARDRLAALSLQPVCEIRFSQASAQDLPIGSASLEAVRFVRVFQHLSDAEGAVQEAARVLKPGGKFLAIDPVWSSLALSGEDQEVSLLIANSASFRMENWMIAPRLPRMLAHAGLVPEPVEVVTRTVTNFEQAADFYSLPTRLTNLVDKAMVSRELADRWLANALEDSRAGRFMCHLPIWLVPAHKPV